MLERIQIRNLVLIDEAEVVFRPGLNIVSGETGAGKSVLLHAISLLLGGRSSSDMIRAEKEDAQVIGVFDLKKLPQFKSRLEALALPISGDELVIKRILSRSGKNRIFLNGEVIPLTSLQRVCEGLVDLCGQHEHQSLIRTEKQLELLDQYAKISKKVDEAGVELRTLRSLQEKYFQSGQGLEDRERKIDFLRYQIQELADADLKENEDEALQAEKLQWQNFEKRRERASEIAQCLEGDSDSIVNRLKVISDRLKFFSGEDPRWENWCKVLDQAQIDLAEFEIQFSRFLDSLEKDPERESYVRERLALLASLRRKYGATVAEMIATQEKLQTELENFESIEVRQEKIQKEIDEQMQRLQILAEGISRDREKAAKKLSQQVTQELKELRLEQAQLKLSLDRRENVESWTETSLQDLAVLDVCLNPGEGFKPLAKVASGGELSRIMLAIRRVIADQGGIGVYLFDEIDAGIGGQTAFVVGKKLQSVARLNQVLCITHLPQIAAFADHHVIVAKRVQKGRTFTEIRDLPSSESIEEIARMLGGAATSAHAIKNARTLVAEAKNLSK